MNPQALASLRDIHLPPAAGWWPPAPGWWLLAGLALLLSALSVRGWMRRRRRGRLAREALARLMEIEREFQGDQDAPALAAKISRLLRQVALRCFPRAEVAGLTGERWLAFLDRALQEEARPFQQGAGRALIEAPYRRKAAVEAGELLSLARRWVEAVAGDGCDV